MKANYHTHTARCSHADGTMREYVEAAIKNGLKILGFSDHVPVGKKWPTKMAMSEAPEYVAEIKALAEEYKDKIKIYIGYEAEYWPSSFNAVFSQLKVYGLDYLILGQHGVECDYCSAYTGIKCDERYFKDYVDSVIAAMQTEKFSYVAHPDIINYHDDKELYTKEMTRLCKASVKYDVPLEFNLLGFSENRQYPHKDFWPIAAKCGCDVVLGWDAHTPAFTGDNEIYIKAIEYLKQFDITPLEEIKFKEI